MNMDAYIPHWFANNLRDREFHERLERRVRHLDLAWSSDSLLRTGSCAEPREDAAEIKTRN